MTLVAEEVRIDVPVSGAPRRSVLTRLVARLGNGVVQVVLALVAVFWMVPVFGLLIASLRDEATNTADGWWTVFTKPAELTLANYAELVADQAVWQSFLNTFYIAVPATVLVVVMASLASYALAWIEFPGRETLTVVVVGLLVMPIQVALIPVAKLFGALGLFGTITGVVLFHVAFGLPFAIFLLRNFFVGLPHELLEAARMDGAGEWRVFTRVVLPLGLPAIASLLIFQFLWVWNDLLVALGFAGGDTQPMTVAIREQLRSFSANIDVIAPAAFLQMAVPLLVFFAFQRYFVQGLLSGSQR
jgi:alpha-glucoside transport system permease protein